jgi:hypothetical protein
VLKTSEFERFAMIVGAPRCGTTTMSKMLGDHPSVSPPFVKEPHFFALHDLRGLDDAALRNAVEKEYLSKFFDSVEPGHSVGFDGSVSYLYVPEQLEPVVRLWPDSRFIVGVRDPMKLLPSLHRRLLYVGDETIRDFTDAWDAVPDRAAGRRIPRSCLDPRFLRYEEAARYATYLDRLFAVVGRERCHVVLFDDLVADPMREYGRIMEFLGLDPLPDVDLSGEREGRAVRWYWLQRLLKRPPKFLHPYLAGQLHKRRLHARGHDDSKERKKALSLRTRILRWNRIDNRPTTSVPVRVQREIREMYQDEVARLARMLGRDLSHWLTVDESAA